MQDQEEEWRERMRWLCEVARTYERNALPIDTAKKLRKFVEEAGRAMVDGIVITYRRPKEATEPSAAQTREFAKDVAFMLNNHIIYSREKRTTKFGLSAGASVSMNYVNGFLFSGLDTGNPLDTAKTCVGALIKKFQHHLKQCPEHAFSRCQGIFLAYKTTQTYCDDNCRQRAFEPDEKKEDNHGKKTR